MNKTEYLTKIKQELKDIRRNAFLDSDLNADNFDSLNRCISTMINYTIKTINENILKGDKIK